MTRRIVKVAEVRVGDRVVGQGSWRATVERVEVKEGLYTLHVEGKSPLGPMTHAYSVEVEA